MFYSASLITRSAVDSSKPMRAGGSFCNITIDGRLSFARACEVAEHYLSKEPEWRGEFAIEKVSKHVDYKNPIVIGADFTAKEILFLL